MQTAAGTALFRCTTWVAGEHVGEPVMLRKGGSATMEEKLSVEATAEKLWSSKQNFKPRDVVKELQVEGSASVARCGPGVNSEQ